MRAAVLFSIVTAVSALGCSPGDRVEPGEYLLGEGYWARPRFRELRLSIPDDRRVATLLFNDGSTQALALTEVDPSEWPVGCRSAGPFGIVGSEREVENLRIAPDPLVIDEDVYEHAVLEPDCNSTPGEQVFLRVAERGPPPPGGSTLPVLAFARTPQ